MEFIYSINCRGSTGAINHLFDSEKWITSMSVPAVIGMTIRYMNGMVFTIVGIEYSKLEDSAVLTLELVK